MKVNFVKMNSQGNDFIIIDVTYDSVSLTSTQIQEISSRSNIGCDQLLILDVQNSEHVACKIYNQDASEALQCGNGMRAIMFFLNKYYKYEQAIIIVGGVKYFSTMNSPENIRVNMGSPTFLQPKALETSSESKSGDDAFFYTVDATETFSYSPIMLGNFHCVVFSDNCYDNWKSISKTLYGVFADVPNISFVKNFNRFIEKKDSYIKLVVKERGSGWTKSCGSGASATGALVIRYAHHVNYPLNTLCINQNGGDLNVEWDFNSKHKNDQNIYLIGPTKFDYEGIWDVKS